MVNPYVDLQLKDKEWQRSFSENVSSDELVWHRDTADRVIEVIAGLGWKFQRDNEIPFNIKIGDIFTIDKMVYHRLIKGDSELVIKIKESNHPNCGTDNCCREC